jgi:hypothetical protein
MALPDVPAEALLQFSERPPRWRAFWEDRFVDLLGRTPTGTSDHDLIAVVDPLEDRTGTDPETSTHFGRHRHLSL